MSPLDVATKLGISRCTIYRLIASGELIATRVRGQWRIDEADLNAYKVANRNVLIAA